MRKPFIVLIVSSLALLFLACASSEPARVAVIGAPEDLGKLTGEWVGTFESGASGRSGSIVFHLTENPEGAHGDVLMVPRHAFVRGEEQRLPGMMSSSSGGGPSVLAIELVRVSANEITGRIAPYPDPEAPEATLETRFTGHFTGDGIEGTFVTYSDHGVSPRHGTWRVHRQGS